MPQIVEDRLLPLFGLAVLLLFGTLALRASTAGFEIGPKGRVYLLHGSLMMLPIWYVIVVFGYRQQLGLLLAVLLISLLASISLWQLKALISGIGRINREQQALIGQGELQMVPLGPAQRILNTVLIIWAAASLLGSIAALVLKGSKLK